MGYGGYNVGTLNAITYANITHAGIPAYTGDVYSIKWIAYTIAFLSFYNYFVGGLIFHGGYSFIDYSNKKAIELLVSLLEV